MNDIIKKNLKGSSSRDLFKHKHKHFCSSSFYAIDLDFCLVEKSPFPGIVAALDYKKSVNDEITFAEVIGYNGLIIRGIPVFVISGEIESGSFSIYEYIGGHHKKPDYRLSFIASVASWLEFEQWEFQLRKSWKEKYASEDASKSAF